jgi:hypothetical protein
LHPCQHQPGQLQQASLAQGLPNHLQERHQVGASTLNSWGRMQGVEQ